MNSAGLSLHKTFKKASTDRRVRLRFFESFLQQHLSTLHSQESLNPGLKKPKTKTERQKLKTSHQTHFLLFFNQVNQKNQVNQGSDIFNFLHIVVMIIHPTLLYHKQISFSNTMKWRN